MNESEMKRTKVGVVGIGHLGKYHLHKYQNLPSCEIVGASDLREERRVLATDTFGCPAWADYRELIGRVDAVSIAVPTGQHFAIARDFLAAGVDVLLEKPMTETLREADTLIALAEARQRILQVGFVERFNPAVIALGSFLRHPLFIESHRLHPFFERGTDVDVILDLMIHDLDIILSFVRSPLKTIDAVGIPVLSNKLDISNVRLTFACGCVANITASRISGKTLQKIRFFGPDGYHAVDYGKRELISLKRQNGANGQAEIVANPVAITPQDPLQEEIRSFIDCVMQRKQPLVSGQEGRKSLDLALTILEQMRTVQEGASQ